MKTKTVTVEDAQSTFPELLTFASKGNEIIIVENNRKLARIVPMTTQSSKPRKPGLNKGEIWTSEDFDQPLPDNYWAGSR
ncbi:MAG: toxin-antitoxin (TA) system antitoxin [Calditrichaeota bacterium]|nr:toxin-antitoxin (TA) system antitoxin [Calditrichota bacterium]